MMRLLFFSVISVILDTVYRPTDKRKRQTDSQAGKQTESVKVSLIF